MGVLAVAIITPSGVIKMTPEVSPEYRNVGRKGLLIY